MKTIKENLVFKNKFAEIYNNDIEDFEGKTGTHIVHGKIGKKESNGVCILPINKTGKILIFKEYRYAIQDYVYTVPTGSEEKNLVIFENAKKELFEESGLISDNWERLSINGFIDPSLRNNKINYFIARDCENEISFKNRESTEDFIDPEWVDVDELIIKINSGKIQFALVSLPVIFYYAMNLKK